ncbi:hypothetical protein [Paenibacillus lutrae]|uniref:Butirosin biosynthesis protein H N-terminal domain-containing protein n=1 Tax=Paenibacillus lutrae TaxID=2078573 RepID=A0A7X3FJY1_9BACL|nr:hypothetical protein [Paenibacillus lutrae]MVP00972.1 hypothetical protein [Paenibacillus lutrae]
MNRILDPNDYLLMNGRPDELWTYLDCYQIPLYFALKERIQFEAEPFAVFLQNPSFYVDIDEKENLLKDIVIRFPWNHASHHIFHVEMNASLGNTLFNDYALELSKGHLVPFGTFPPRVPFYKNFVSFESKFIYPKNYEEFDHIFMGIKIENNKLIYLENAPLLNKSYIPYNGSRNVGIIDLVELEPAFSCYFKYFKITIDITKVNFHSEANNFFNFCKQILDYSDSEPYRNESSLFHPNIQGLLQLKELLQNEIIHLESKAYSYNCNYCELLEWKLSIIQQSKHIFLQYLKQNQSEIQGINNIWSSLEHANKVWIALINKLRFMIISSKYQENIVVNYLNDVIKAELTLLEDIRGLVKNTSTI